jgi:hypothetical protein
MGKVVNICGESVSTIQRRVISLRLDGLSFPEIGEALGMTTTVVIGHIIKALGAIPDFIQEEEQTIRALELRRLDALQFGLWDRAESGDLDAIQAILTIIELRVKLTGVSVERVPGVSSHGVIL